MKDLSDYVVKEGNSFFVDTNDIDSNEPIWENGEVFSFEYEGKVYKGSAVDSGEEMSQIFLVD